MFEATERVGGRTYSVRYGDRNLVVDAGAYRTWPEYTPVTHALITQELGLTVACYDPSEVPCEKYVVVDSTTGHNVGLATYVERLADDLFAAGAPLDSLPGEEPFAVLAARRHEHPAYTEILIMLASADVDFDANSTTTGESAAGIVNARAPGLLKRVLKEAEERDTGL